MLLVISLLACVTFLLWQYGAPWINQFDRFLVNKYQGHYKSRLSDAMLDLPSDPARGVVKLENLLEDLEGVSKRDRLARLKRTGFKKLVEALEVQGKKEQALKWVDRWVTFDERDIPAQLWRSRLLLTIPGQENTGKVLLDNLYEKLPESSLVSEEYARRLFFRGDFAEAFLAAYRTYSLQNSLTDQHWQLFWDTGTGFNARQKQDVFPVIDNTGHSTFPIKLPVRIKRLRIDPPIASHITISKPVLIYIDGSSERSLDLWRVSLGLADMKKEGTVLTTSGADDPYFYWALPSGMINAKGFEGWVEAQVEEAYPAIIGRIAALPEAGYLVASLEAKGEFEAAQKLQKIRKQQQLLKISSLVGTPLEIFWRKPGEVFVEKRKVRVEMTGNIKNEALSFSMEIPVNANFSVLRIDFFDMTGIEYDLESLEISGEEGSKQIELSEKNIIQRHSVKVHGARFLVTGIDPYFSVALPGGIQTVKSILIRGVVR